MKQLMGDVKQRLAGHSTSSGSESKELYDRVKNLVIEIGTTEESNSLIQQISTASRFESVTKHKEMIENVVSMLEKKSKQYQDQMDTDASTEFSLSSLASFLDPIQLLDRANDLMPSMSEKLVGYVEYMEQYHTGHKSLIKTDWILDKAKQYLETAESDEFKQSISTTMSNTQVQVSTKCDTRGLLRQIRTQLEMMYHRTWPSGETSYRVMPRQGSNLSIKSKTKLWTLSWMSCQV